MGDGLRAGIADELTKHLSTMSRGWEDKSFQLGCTCGHDRGTATVADVAANLDEHLNAFRLHVADALLAGPLQPLQAAVARVSALADQLSSEHKPGCCAGGDCLLGGEHTHPDDPVLASELVGLLSDNPPPFREHRMIPCPRECDCGAHVRAGRLSRALDGGDSDG